MLWISRNLNIVDQVQLKTKFFRFILMFCTIIIKLDFVLTILNIFARYIFTNFVMLYLIFFTTWIPQILANFYSGVRKPLSFGYIWSVTISKLFYVFYLGLCPYNVLLLKPKLLEVFLITFTILFEVFFNDL